MCPDQPAAGGQSDAARSAFSFGGEDLGNIEAPTAAPGARAPRRLRARGAAVSLAGLALALVAVIAATRGGSGGGTAATGAPTPLSRAAYVTSQARGFEFQLSIDAALGEHDFTIDAEGAMDERTLEGTMHMQVEGQELNEVIKNPYVYVHLPAAVAGAKSWVRANLRSYTQSIGAPDPFSQGNSSPTQMLKLLGAGGQVSSLGNETVRGVNTTRYHALVDFTSYAAQVPAGERAAMQRYAQVLQRITGSSSLPIDVWIDAQQRVRRFSTTVEVCTPDGPLSETVSMELFNYGHEPVVVTPAESEVTDVSGKLDSQASQAISQLSC